MRRVRAPSGSACRRCRILHAVHNEQRSADDIRQHPRARLHDRENSLRRIRAARSLNARDPISSTRPRGWRARRERLATRRACELGATSAPLNSSRRPALLPQAYASTTPARAAARLAALEIADGRLQITANACPRAGHRCPKIGPSLLSPRHGFGTHENCAHHCGSDSGGPPAFRRSQDVPSVRRLRNQRDHGGHRAEHARVSAWQALPAALVAKQIDALAETCALPRSRPACWIREIVDTVAERIAHHRLTTYVLDP